VSAGVKGTTRVARIYFSTTQYRSEDRPSPLSEPLVAKDFPKPGDRLRIWFGPVPADIALDFQVLIAIANTRLNRIVGHPAETGDAGITMELQKVQREDQLALGELWYVTLAVDRPTVFSDDEITGEQIEWLSATGAMEEVEDALRADAAPAIEVAIAAMDTVIPNQIATEQCLAKSYVFATGLGPTTALRMTGSAKGIGIHDPSTFPTEELRVRIAGLGKLVEDLPLGTAAHFYEAMLKEADPMRRFLWGFVALEALTNVLYTHLHDAATNSIAMTGVDGATAPSGVTAALLRDKGGLPLGRRFALVAGYLSPSTAAADLDRFQQLKENRDAMAHGKSRVESLSFPAGELSDLLDRYFGRAVGLHS
jgi:hypothetical protein